MPNGTNGRASVAADRWTCSQCERPTETLPLCRECEDANGPACERCGATGTDLATVQNGNGADVLACGECARRAGFRQCEHCDEWRTDGATVLDCGEWRCAECIRATDCRTCERCHGGGVTSSGARRGPDGEWYCADHSDDFSSCDSCGSSVWMDDAESNDAGDVFCASCYSSRGTDPEPVTYRAAREGLAPSIPDYLTVGVEIEAVLPAFPSDWNLTEDSSVSDHGGKETVSPVLTGSEGMRRLWGAVAAIGRAGGEEVENGGTHVHVGAQAFTAAEIVNVYRAWAEWGEDVFAGLVPGHRWGSGYCASEHGDDSIPSRLTDSIGGIDSLASCSGSDLCDAVEREFDHDDRYVSLNPVSLSYHGTIECRIFPTCVDAETVTTWAALVARFVHVSAHGGPEHSARVRKILDAYGTLRAGLRILSRGCDSLRASAVDVSARKARGIPTRYSAHPTRDPWGSRKAERKAERKAARAASPRRTRAGDVDGSGFLFALPEADRRALARAEHARTVEPLPACECEHYGSGLAPFVHCPTHGLPAFGGLGRHASDARPYRRTRGD